MQVSQQDQTARTFEPVQEVEVDVEDKTQNVENVIDDLFNQKEDYLNQMFDEINNTIWQSLGKEVVNDVVMGVIFGGLAFGTEAIRSHNIIKPVKPFKYNPKISYTENLAMYEKTMQKSENLIKKESEKLLKKQAKGKLSQREYENRIKKISQQQQNMNLSRDALYESQEVQKTLDDALLYMKEQPEIEALSNFDKELAEMENELENVNTITKKLSENVKIKETQQKIIKLRKEIAAKLEKEGFKLSEVVGNIKVMQSLPQNLKNEFFQYHRDNRNLVQSLTGQEKLLLNELENLYKFKQPFNGPYIASYDDILYDLNEYMQKFEKSNIDNLLEAKYQSNINKLPEPIREKYLSLQKQNRQQTFNKNKFYNKDKDEVIKPKINETITVENVQRVEKISDKAQNLKKRFDELLDGLEDGVINYAQQKVPQKVKKLTKEIQATASSEVYNPAMEKLHTYRFSEMKEQLKQIEDDVAAFRKQDKVIDDFIREPKAKIDEILKVNRAEYELLEAKSEFEKYASTLTQDEQDFVRQVDEKIKQIDNIETKEQMNQYMKDNNMYYFYDDLSNFKKTLKTNIYKEATNKEYVLKGNQLVRDVQEGGQALVEVGPEKLAVRTLQGEEARNPRVDIQPDNATVPDEIEIMGSAQKQEAIPSINTQPMEPLAAESKMVKKELEGVHPEEQPVQQVEDNFHELQYEYRIKDGQNATVDETLKRARQKYKEKFGNNAYKEFNQDFIKYIDSNVRSMEDLQKYMNKTGYFFKGEGQTLKEQIKNLKTKLKANLFHLANEGYILRPAIRGK